ncbi:MAG TPA: hypothetical protein VGK74_24735 [Symbiobacteriaceae bacterium]|jgi:uncharacterized protein (TIGR02646 family)
MIKRRRRPLRTRDRAALEVWQRGLNEVPPYDKRIGDAWNAFTVGKGKPLRQRINRALQYQCVSRCVYCERSEFETIDHYRPKQQFPATAFAWPNFNGACWTCNRDKSQPLLFHHDRPMIINPMDEDPAAFFYIDPKNGFMAAALHLAEGTDDYIRADYTISKLKLNERGLPKERRLAADNLRQALKFYELTRGHRKAEEALLVACRERNALRAIVRQVMTNPDPQDKPLVDYCLQHSHRVKTFLQAIQWL